MMINLDFTLVSAYLSIHWLSGLRFQLEVLLSCTDNCDPPPFRVEACSEPRVVPVEDNVLPLDQLCG